jgi:flagellar motor protein MotB
MATTKPNGPILLRTGDFDLLTTADLGFGTIIVPSRRGFAVAGVAILVAVVVCAFLALDRAEKVDDSERAKLAYTATETELVAAKSEIKSTSDIVKSLAKDSADLAVIRAADDAASAKAASLEGMLKTELKREIANGDAHVSKHGSRVTLTLRDWALFDSDQASVSTRGIDLLMRAGTIFAHGDDKTVRVLAFTDDKAADPWTTTSTQAASVAKFLETNADVPALRIEAVGKGAVDPVAHSKAKSRRIELVVDEK